MRRIALALLLLLPLLTPPAASAEGPRRVRVALTGGVTLRALFEAGFDVVQAKDGAWAELLEWPGDEARLAALGASGEGRRVLDENPGRTAAERARAELAAQRGRASARTQAIFDPPPGEGALAGFWTLSQVKEKLDDLVATDTRGLVADKLDTLGWTLQNRPVWGLELGLRPVGPDSRPVAFFNALTHAREPEGMQALFHFVDDLLATYDSDPVTRYLLEGRRLYFVPVVNPDGYFFNQRIYDTTGTLGMWRKNLRDNDGSHTTNSADGVDINRNYGYQWGYNNVGSSLSPSQQTFRGPSAFSEPESRIQRDALIALRPVTGLSVHTFGDLFIHPWGYTTEGAPDSAKFQAWTDELTFVNGYTGGPGPRVLYEVNGDFNDYAYGETTAKPRAYTWTPEIGGPQDDFWPPPSRVVPLAEEMLRAFRTTAGIAGPWVRAAGASIAEGALNAGHLAHLFVRAENIGASGVAGPSLEASLTALDPEVEVLSGPVAYPSLASFQSADPAGAPSGGGFVVAAADTVTPGRLMRFRVDFTDAAGLHCRDTVEVIVGTPTVVFLSDCSSPAGWTATGPWGVRANDPAHPSSYCSDSPAGRYAPYLNASMGPSVALDLSHGVHAWAFFENRWTFESDYDGTLFEASRDNSIWTPLPTGATTVSNAANFTGGGLPAFEGSRWLWAADRADLSAFAGGPANATVHLRFRSVTDPGFQLDGFSFDSLRVLVYDPALQPAPVAVPPREAVARLALAPPSPNPSRDLVRFAFDLPAGTSDFALEVLDVQGRRVVSYAESAGRAAASAAGTSWRWGWNLRDDAGRHVPPGMYLVRLRSGAGEAVRRLVVLP